MKALRIQKICNPMIVAQRFDFQEFIKAFGLGLIALLLTAIIFSAWSWWAYNAQDERDFNLAAQTIVMERDGTQNAPADLLSQQANKDLETKGTDPEFAEIIPLASPRPSGKRKVPQLDVSKLPVSQASSSSWDGELYLPNLIEPSAFGPLPQRDRQENMTPFEAYRMPFTSPDKRSLLSIVMLIDHLDPEITKALISQLPPYITLSFSPYFKNPDPLVKQAKEAGHEIWLSLPIEGSTPLRNDSGPLTLRRDFSVIKNRSIGLQLMARLKGYTGLLIPLEGKPTLTMGSPRVEKLFKDIFDRGLAIAYASPSLHETLQIASAGRDVPAIQINRVTQKPFEMVEESLNTLIQQDGENFSIILPDHPRQISRIKDWIQSLPKHGYVLAPLSAQSQN